jgi:DNA replication protein DnaC
VLLEYYSEQPKLPTMLREYEKIAVICRQEPTDYQTFLLRLAEQESIERERRSAERRVKAARFPVVKTLDSFDFGAQPSINQALVRELMRGDYMDRRENVLLGDCAAVAGQQRHR